MRSPDSVALLKGDISAKYEYTGLWESHLIFIRIKL